MKTIDEIKAIRQVIERRKEDDYFTDVTRDYAFELLDKLEEMAEYDANIQINERTALNGASNWYQYSFGGLSLCYNDDLRERLHVKAGSPYANDGEVLLTRQAIQLEFAFDAIYQTHQKIKIGAIAL